MQFNRPQHINVFLKVYQDLKQKHPNSGILLSLDHFHQAQYCASYAIRSEDDFYLDDENLSDEAFDKLQVEVIQKSLSSSNVQLNPCFEKLYYSADDIQKIVEINRQPLKFIDDIVHVRLQKLLYGADKLALLPSGYFLGDLKPHENYALIQQLEDYGWEFFGIGACLLGFININANCESTYTLIKNLYHIQDHQALKDMIFSQQYLFMSYTEELVCLFQ